MCTGGSLASCLINAQPFPAHRPAADDWQIDDWSLPRATGRASAHFVDSWCPFRCSYVLLLNQMFWKQCTVRQYRFDLYDQSAQEIRVRIYVRLRVVLFWHFSWRIRKVSTLSSANFTDGNILITERTHKIKITCSRSARAQNRQIANLIQRE